MKNLQADHVSNHLIWGTIESKTSRYFCLLPDGTKHPDEELRNKVSKAFKVFLHFFYQNGLLKLSPFDESSAFIDQQYRRSDLSDEGFQMLKRGAERWLDSKGAQKEPADFSRLDKILSDVKAGSKSP